MPRKLGESPRSFIDGGGWSAHKFVKHAEYAFAHFKGKIEMGKSVAYASLKGNLVKIYAHHNGRSNEWLTVTDENGKELGNVHCKEPVNALLKLVQGCLSRST